MDLAGRVEQVLKDSGRMEPAMRSSAFNQKQFLSMLDAVASAMEDFRISDLQDQMKEILRTQYPTEIHGLINALEEAVRDLDDTAVASCCEKISQQIKKG